MLEKSYLYDIIVKKKEKLIVNDYGKKFFVYQ